MKFSLQAHREKIRRIPLTHAKPTNVRWLIVCLLAGFTFLGHFNRLSISVAANAVFIGPGKLSEQQMGLVYLAFLLVYTLGMLPGGYLIDRIGPRWSMTGMGIGLGSWAMLTGITGWSGLSIAAMFLPLLVIRGLGGATSIPLHPGSARAVSLWMPLEQRSTANGIVNAGALAGIALSYPVFGWLLDHMSWQWAFVICGGALVLFSLLWHFLSADDSAAHRWSNKAEEKLIHSSEPSAPRTRTSFKKVFTMFRNRNLVLLTLSYGALSYVQYLFFYWIEYYFKNELKLPSSESRNAAFVVTIAMAVGMVFGGWAADRICRLLGILNGCRIIALSSMGFCTLFSMLGVRSSEPQHIVLWFALALASLGLSEGIFWTTAPTLEKQNVGVACAFLNTGGNAVGMLAPVFTPWIGKSFGWNSSIIVACFICAVGGLLWFGIRPKVIAVQLDEKLHLLV